MRKALVFISLIISVIVLSLSMKPAEPAVEAVFRAGLRSLIQHLETLHADVSAHKPLPEIKKDFIRARLSYKKTAVLTDYFFPNLQKLINAPDLKRTEEDRPDDVFAPHGFQVIERMLYSGFEDSAYASVGEECRILLEAIISIREQDNLAYKFQDNLVFDAMRQADIRLTSMGITGFDSPIALNSLEEAIATLEGMEKIFDVFGLDKEKTLSSRAREYIRSSKDFNTFDRLVFIKTFSDPLYALLAKSIIEKNMQLPEERRPLNQASASMFAKDFLDIRFFSPNKRYQLTPQRIQLGESLFYDSIFSLTSKRTCAGCHNPSKAFTDGLPAPLALNGSDKLKRNTPTLLNAALQTRFFYDSRTSVLENQLNAVVHNVDEMNGSLKESIKRIRANKKYAERFEEAYPNDRDPVTEYNIANSISSYVRSLVILKFIFDTYMLGGEEQLLSKSEKRGFNLFAGKAKCGTCHYIPLFNGLVPPEFTETESEVLGVPLLVNKKAAVPDTDEGKYLFTKSAIHRNAFKTSTLRNIALTAPYMHNGVYKTLEEVMDFYNKGGGAGIHIATENQTLPRDKLNLSKKEIKDVIAFLKTLNDKIEIRN